MTDHVIWMFWHHGRDAAPEVVKLCVDSWVTQNPTWKVIVLDARSVTQYVDATDLGPQYDALPPQQASVLLRLALLARHGGVWADATAYCMRPLDSWLPEHLSTGFFAFRDPGPDRQLSNWFLAAHAGGHLISELHRVTRSYFEQNHFPRQESWLRRRVARRLGRDFNVSVATTRHWFSWPVRRVLRVYPYFVSHYLFAKLLSEDTECRALWDRTKPAMARPLLVLCDHAVNGDLAAAELAVSTQQAPMYKLNWRVDTTSAYWAGLLTRLRQAT